VKLFERICIENVFLMYQSTLDILSLCTVTLKIKNLNL
jgi:hypothetical protein